MVFIGLLQNACQTGVADNLDLIGDHMPCLCSNRKYHVFWGRGQFPTVLSTSNKLYSV